MQVPGLPAAAYISAATQFAEFDAYVRGIVTGDPDCLDDGIIRTLVTGWRDGTHDLTEDELVGDIANVVFAGHETTVSTLSNILARLLRDRHLWNALQEGVVDVAAGRSSIKNQMTFGHGRHVCIGAALARAQITLAITALPRAQPGMRLSGEVSELPNHFLRMTPELPVTR